MFTVLTGGASGFTDRSQMYRCDDDSIEYNVNFWSIGHYLESNKAYYGNFKYKSNVPIYCSNVPIYSVESNTYPTNTGAPSLVSYTGMTNNSRPNEGFGSSDKVLNFGIINDPMTTGDYMIIDEVNMYENVSPNFPMCVTYPKSNYTSTTVQLNGMVNPYGDSSAVSFEYFTGSTLPYTNTINATQSPINGTGDFSASYNLSTTPGFISYNYRIKSSNAYGTTYGENEFFYSQSAPVIYTYYTNGQTNTGVTLSTSLRTGYLSTTIEFEWGTGITYGNTVAATGSPIGSGYDPDAFNKSITGLTTGITYHFRVKSSNALGTVYSSDYPFSSWSEGVQYSGGTIIHFDDNSHINGTIVMNSDLSTSATWGCYGVSIGGTSSAYGTADTNTGLIVAGCATDGIAARLCNDVTWSGYTDWWLPSYNELISINTYRAILGINNGDIYWTSTEYNVNSAYAYNIGTGFSLPDKNVNYRVRGIRYF